MSELISKFFTSAIGASGIEEHLRTLSVLCLLVVTVVWLLSNLLSALPKVNGWAITRLLGDNRAYYLLMGVVLGLVASLLSIGRLLRWPAVLAGLPTAMVLYQYVFLWLNTPRIEQRDESTAESRMTKAGFDRARAMIDHSYSQRTLFIRFGFPAIVLFVEGITLLLLLLQESPPDTFASNGTLAAAFPVILRSARYGAAGAYAYVLLELGRRSYRHDITGGSALGSVVAMAIGPLLAGTLALLFRWQPSASDSPWQSGVVLFFAGFAPRRVITAIEQAAQQMLRSGVNASPYTRALPLATIRGINATIEERLAEEGIYNVQTLAAAEPIRLLRNTSFDLLQIVSWIDEALLITYVPRGWEALEDQGITGAIDLAYLDSADGAVGTKGVADLANKLGTTPELFTGLVNRVKADQQVLYIWALYNSVSADGQVVPPGQLAPG